MWDFGEAVAYYKKQGAARDQNLLISLLREVQQECAGKIPSQILPLIAEEIGVKESYLLALIKRIPSLQLTDVHSLELCAGPNCSKYRALSAFAEKYYGQNPGKFTLKYVPCMRLCGKGPNIRWDGKVYHQADEALIRQLMKDI